MNKAYSVLRSFIRGLWEYFYISAIPAGLLILIVLIEKADFDYRRLFFILNILWQFLILYFCAYCSWRMVRENPDRKWLMFFSAVVSSAMGGTLIHLDGEHVFDGMIAAMLVAAVSFVIGITSTLNEK